MALIVDFYFDFTSPYGYVASQVIDGILEPLGARTRWHSFMVSAAYKQFNASNPLAHTTKEKYFRLDLPRTAAFHGVPFAFPATWPEGLIAAGRAFIAIEHRDPEAAKRFAKAALRAYWSGGKALANPDTVADVAASVGEDRASIRSALDDPAIKQRFVAANEAAFAAGIFGSPQMVLQGELFWGTDRLEQLKAALAQARAA